MDRTVECPHCGSTNPGDAGKCRSCGKMLPHKHVPSPGSRVCAHCGEPIQDGADLCNACTRPVREVVMSNLPKDIGETECVHWSEKPAASGRSARVAMAGILVLMAGALGIGQAVVALDPELSESFVSAVEGIMPMSATVGDWFADYVVLQVWAFLAGLVAIAGGIFALTGTRYELALMGGVFSVLAVGFLLGAFLGLVGLLLIAFSRKEFLPEC